MRRGETIRSRPVDHVVDANCYADNTFATFFALIGVLPPCP